MIQYINIYKGIAMKTIYITDEMHNKLKIRAIHNSESMQDTTATLLTKALKH